MKPYLSPTQIDMFTRCGEAYRRRYVEGEIIPPGLAMIQGTCVHKPAAVNFRQKVESHADLKPAEFRELAAAEFQTAIAGGYVMAEDEVARGTAIVLGEAKDAAVQMAAFHGERQAPDYQPVLVEERVRIELPMAARDLLGIVDLADDKDRVIDFKTSGRRKSQGDADTSVQLTTYAAAFKAKTGREPSELRLDTIVRTKTKIDRDVVRSARDAADMQALANRINAVTQAVEAGVFVPATPGAWWCGPRFCGYWNTCPYVNSERRVAAEANGF